MAEHGSGRKRGVLQVRATGSKVARDVLLPAQAFIQTEGRSGILLLGAAVLAVLWANSPLSDLYVRLWAHKITIDLGLLAVTHDLRHWVNDGLMALFFFVVALEIKRELVHGELSTRRQAALPVAGALGGMVVPALVFLALNRGTPAAAGWGIPVATDIAFALGVLALLGPRIPTEARLFLLAVAVVDDVGAILVIAVFYTSQVQYEALIAAAALIALILLLRRMGARSIGLFVVPGLLLWLAIHESGVHATIAGVILALLTPSEPFFTPRSFGEAASGLLTRLRAALDSEREDEVNAVLGEIEELSRLTESPVERLERRFHPWSNYVILPLFALANAGLSISAESVGNALTRPLTQGIILGLVVGKPVGIWLCSWLSVRSGLASLPSNLRWIHVAGAGALAGIGFTVSLFITGLAFARPEMTGDAKMGVFLASLLAGALGYAVLRWGSRRSAVNRDEATA